MQTGKSLMIGRTWDGFPSELLGLNADFKKCTAACIVAVRQSQLQNGARSTVTRLLKCPPLSKRSALKTSKRPVEHITWWGRCWTATSEIRVVGGQLRTSMSLAHTGAEPESDREKTMFEVINNTGASLIS